MELDSVDEYISELDVKILPYEIHELIINKDKLAIIDYLEENAKNINDANIRNNTELPDLIHQIFNFDQKLKLAYNYYLQKRCICPIKIPWMTKDTIDNNSLSQITQAKFYRFMILHWYECDDMFYQISNFRYLVNIVTILLQNQKLKKQMKCITNNYNLNKFLS